MSRHIHSIATVVAFSGAAVILPRCAAFAQGSTHPSAAPNARADTSCVAALDTLQAIFSRDYPGYRDKVPGHEAALRALTDSVRAIAQTSDDYRVCIPALRRWVHFFRDPHMAIWYAGPPAPHARAEHGDAAAATSEIAPDDPSQPWVRFLDDSTAEVRLATLDVRYRPVTDSILAVYRTRLLATPYLIVDMRGNPGGCTCVYDGLTPLLYTGPISLQGADMLASADNIAFLRKWVADNPLSLEDKNAFWADLRRMAGHPGELVTLVADTVIRRDTIFPLPRRIAVLVDSGCASSCEDFVLEAKQSAKVTILGASHTAGRSTTATCTTCRSPAGVSCASRAREIGGCVWARHSRTSASPRTYALAGTSDPVSFARRYLTSHDAAHSGTK